MKKEINRRQFSAIALGAGAALPGLAAPSRRLKPGHTGITWGFRPENAAEAIPDVASLGYWGFESFGNVLEAWEPKGGLDQVLEKNNLPLVSAYCPVNLTDPAQRKDETAKLVRWANLIKKCGGSVAVIGPNGVKRDTYNFAEARPNIIASLNDMAKAVADVGIIGVLHQHTGTCVEVHDEVYSVLEAVDTRYVKFGPDVGQLQKGGSDPVQVLKDFLSIVSHVHLKDWDGGPEMEGYCPLGRGKVNLPAVLDLLEKSNIKNYIMTELDPSRGMPYKPIDAARMSKQYLIGQGYTFRS